MSNEEEQQLQDNTGEQVESKQEEQNSEESVAEQLYGKGEEENQETEDQEAAKESEEEQEESEDSKEEQDESVGKDEIPDEYVLKAESELVSEDYMERFKADVKEQKLTQGQAEELLQIHEQAIEDYRNELQEQHNAVQTKWVDEIKSDKEFGGDNLNESSEHTKRVVNRFADESLKEELRTSGYGNHPGLFKMLAKIGQAMGNDNFESGKHESKPKKSMAETFYGNNN